MIATTGHLSRYLFAAGDRPLNFYMQGSMGHASSIATGLSAVRPDLDLLVLDGDGAALMHLGALSGVGHQAGRRFTHVIVDNGSYASTGGQPTTSTSTDFQAIATACGYRTSTTVETAAALIDALDDARRPDGPHCIVVRTRDADAQAPPRASTSVGLAEIASRIRKSLPDPTSGSAVRPAEAAVAADPDPMAARAMQQP